MIIVTYFLVGIFSCSVTFYLLRTIFSINIIFTVLWCVVGITAYINPLELVDPRIEIHILILLSVILFNFIYLIFKKKVFTQENVKYIPVIDYKKAKLLNILALLLFLPNIINGFQAIVTYGFSSVRDIVYVSVSEGSSVVAILTRTIPGALFSLIVLITAVDLANNQYKLIKWAIVDIVLYTLSFGGRFFIYNFLVYYIATIIIFRFYKKIKIKKRYVFLGVLILMYITAIRNEGVKDIIDQIILYFTGSVSYLEYILRFPEIYGLNKPLLCGYLTFGFIFEPIALILKIFFREIELPSAIFNEYAQQWTNIGSIENPVWFNNNTTMFYSFIKDFGYIGCLLGVAILACVICVLERKLIKEENCKWIYFYVYLIGVIMSSSISYSLSSLRSSVILLCLFWVVKDKYKKIHIKI